MKGRCIHQQKKGGTGKTTFAVNTAAFFRPYKAKRVLLVDMDSQGHRPGKTLGLNVRMVPKSVYDVMLDPQVPLAEAVLPTRIDGLAVLPANKNMAGFSGGCRRPPGPSFVVSGA